MNHESQGRTTTHPEVTFFLGKEELHRHQSADLYRTVAGAVGDGRMITISTADEDRSAAGPSEGLSSDRSGVDGGPLI